MASRSYDELIEFCDNEIKSGRSQSVTHALGELTLTKIPRQYRLPLAKICRRTGLIAMGLRLLTHLVRPEKRDDPKADAFETAEYASLLARNGSVKEALELLNGLDATNCPEAHLFRGFCHITIWDYASAQSHLEAFLKTKPPEYTALVAKVNLAATFVSTRQHEKANKQIDENLKTAQANKASLLIANCHELRGQVFLQQENFKECRKSLNEALRIASEGQIIDLLHIKKWLAVLDALETKSVKPLQDFQPLAIESRHWDAVREADLYSLKVQFDQQTFDRLYFGTPLPAYRERILFETKGQPSEFFLLGGPQKNSMDLSTGEMTGKTEINPGKKIHQVLTVLCRDFYSPINVAAVFSELYEGEYFDIFSSPGRVHQIIQRTKGWLKKSKIPAEIKFDDGGYTLGINGPFSFKIPVERDRIDSHSVVLEKLQKIFGCDNDFALNEACEELAIPKSSLHRSMTALVASGDIEKTGAGKNVRYRTFASDQ